MWDFVVLAAFFAVLVLFFVWASRWGRRNQIDVPDETEPTAERNGRNDDNDSGKG